MTDLLELWYNAGALHCRSCRSHGRGRVQSLQT